MRVKFPRKKHFRNNHSRIPITICVLVYLRFDQTHIYMYATRNIATGITACVRWT